MMISDATLADAVNAGVITAAQAESLRALEVAVAPPPPLHASPAPADAVLEDEESPRFITGFSDIFVALGLCLFFGAAGYFLQRFAGVVAMWIGLAALAWLLAEFFTRSRRMALPSIILLGFFAGCVFAAATQILAGWSPTSLAQLVDVQPSHWLTSISLAGLLAAGFAGLHYWRFRVPITVAAAAVALSTAFVAFAYWLWPNPDRRVFNGLMLICGLSVFVVAMRFDVSDRDRTTRRTDIAFWLHLLAAPLIMHPLIAFFLRDDGSVETSGAIAILGIFLALGLVAVAIDRRALLVSGLTYAGIAFGTLLRQTGFSDMTVPATLLALGTFVLLLSAGWSPLRRALLRLFPAPFVRYLPHPLRRSP
ncbi:MAG: hypothetical protein ACLPID_04440 [Beijerinckiaceae bacterium]